MVNKEIEELKKAADFGSVKAMLSLALHKCIYIACTREESLPEDEKLPEAKDFLEAEELALKTLEENKKESSDCPDGVIHGLYYWLARIYDSKNPDNPIYDEEKAAYWDKKYKEAIK